MIYVHPLSRTDQRALHHLQRTGTSTLRQRAQIVLMSAQGWCVPALARMLACCRRTVRHWLHAFLDQGLIGLQGQPRGRPSHTKTEAAHDSATHLSPEQIVPTGKEVPVIELTVPEVRRLLSLTDFFPKLSSEHSWRWSVWRRYKQALAKRSHYRKRGAQLPAFRMMWLPAA
jgi:transposase